MMDEAELTLIMSNGGVLSVDPSRKPRCEVNDSYGHIHPVKTFIARRWLKANKIQVVAKQGTLQEIVLAEYADLFHQRGNV